MVKETTSEFEAENKTFNENKKVFEELNLLQFYTSKECLSFPLYNVKATFKENKKNIINMRSQNLKVVPN